MGPTAVLSSRRLYWLPPVVCLSARPPAWADISFAFRTSRKTVADMPQPPHAVPPLSAVVPSSSTMRLLLTSLHPGKTSLRLSGLGPRGPLQNLA